MSPRYLPFGAIAYPAKFKIYPKMPPFDADLMETSQILCDMANRGGAVEMSTAPSVRGTTRTRDSSEPGTDRNMRAASQILCDMASNRGGAVDISSAPSDRDTTRTRDSPEPDTDCDTLRGSPEPGTECQTLEARQAPGRTSSQASDSSTAAASDECAPSPSWGIETRGMKRKRKGPPCRGFAESQE